MPNLPNSTFRVLKFGAGGFSKTPANVKHARYGLFVVLKFGAGHFQKFLPTQIHNFAFLYSAPVLNENAKRNYFWRKIGNPLYFY